MADGTGSTGSRTATFSAVVPVVASLIALKPAPAFTDAYDLRGNRTSTTTPQGQAQYTYDQANRLTTFATPGSPAAAYVYNGDGLRQNKTVSGSTTAYSWDLSQGVPLLLSETTTQGTARYVYGVHGLPIERIAPDNSVLYHHQDQLGSTRALTDASGAVQATYTYDAYGNLCATCKTGPADTRFKFAGQYTDVETGFQYLRARYYDSATAQFISRDPMVTTTRSAYGYIGGSPLNGSDPSGLAAGDQCAGPGGSQTYYGGRTTEAHDQSDCAAQGGTYSYHNDPPATWGGGGMSGMNPETNQSFDSGATTWDDYTDSSRTIVLDTCQSLFLSILRAPRYIRFGISIGEHAYRKGHNGSW